MPLTPPLPLLLLDALPRAFSTSVRILGGFYGFPTSSTAVHEGSLRDQWMPSLAQKRKRLRAMYVFMCMAGNHSAWSEIEQTQQTQQTLTLATPASLNHRSFASCSSRHSHSVPILHLFAILNAGESTHDY